MRYLLNDLWICGKYTCGTCADDDHITLGVLVQILEVAARHSATNLRLADALKAVVIKWRGSCDGRAHRRSDREFLSASFCGDSLTGAIGWHGQTFDCRASGRSLNSATGGDAVEATHESCAESHVASDLQAYRVKFVSQTIINVWLACDLLEIPDIKHAQTGRDDKSKTRSCGRRHAIYIVLL